MDPQGASLGCASEEWEMGTAADTHQSRPAEAKTVEPAVTPAEGSGKRRRKQIKYVDEDDDLSETEQALATEKKRRARQLDYQQRTVRVEGDRFAWGWMRASADLCLVRRCRTWGTR